MFTIFRVDIKISKLFKIKLLCIKAPVKKTFFFFHNPGYDLKCHMTSRVSQSNNRSAAPWRVRHQHFRSRANSSANLAAPQGDLEDVLSEKKNIRLWSSLTCILP
jgi:hypothetical protein